MFINSDSIRNFFESHSNSAVVNNTDLDSLVLTYRQSRDEVDFSNLCNKAIGIVISLAKKTNKSNLSVEDIYSYTLETLLKAVDKWNPDKTKFITYFHTCVINILYVLKRKKSIRDYNKYNVSLEELTEEFDFEPSIEANYNLRVKLNYNNDKEKDLIDFLTKFNTTKKCDICRGLNIANSELNKLIRNIKNQNKKLV